MPALPDLDELLSVLPAQAAYLAPTLVGADLVFLAAAARHKARVDVRPGVASAIRQSGADFRSVIESLIDLYRQRHTLGSREQQAIDGRLDALGTGPPGVVITKMLSELGFPGG